MSANFMFFESVTEWQADDYIIRVQVGIFTTREKAEAFGNQPMKLVRNGDRLVLRDNAGKELDEAFDENITVFKLKDSAKGKLRTTHDDFKQINILIRDFGNHQNPSLFRLFSYGVSESSKLVICGDNGKPLSRNEG